MTENHQKFSEELLKSAFHETHQTHMEQQFDKYKKVLSEGKQQYERLDLAKQRAGKIKRNVLDDLEKFIKDFEGNFQKNGGELIWAENAAEAIKAVSDIVDKHAIKNAVKSKSIISQEIDLSTHLQKMGVNTFETDLGDYIVELAKEKPYHIVSTAIHKSLKEVATLFNVKFDLSENSTAKEIAQFVSEKLRKHFFNADMGVTGVNFLLVNQGAIAISENEGNGVLSASLPKVHLALGGIEELIPDVEDLDLFSSLLSTYTTGKKIDAYNTIITGPRKATEQDGPDKVYLILIDNGRTKVLNTKYQRAALSCIKCGACSNVCPIYKTIGGHAYGTVFNGPIGSVLTPLMRGDEAYNHLSHACTSCGKCNEECPVEIPIDELLLRNRRYAVKNEKSNQEIAKLIKTYKRAMKSRKILDLPGSGIKKLILSSKIKKQWGTHKVMPKLAKKSFSQLWKEENR